jgi:hypothetical protein
MCCTKQRMRALFGFPDSEAHQAGEGAKFSLRKGDWSVISNLKISLASYSSPFQGEVGWGKDLRLNN